MLNTGYEHRIKRKNYISLFSFIASGLLLWGKLGTSASDSPFALRKTTLPIKQIDLGEALVKGSNYLAIDWEKLDFQNPRIISSNHFAYALENDRVQVILLPSMGKVYSIIDRKSGHNQLWTNPVVRPIKAHNDTGWWMIWGGIEFTIPRGEHGTTWSLPWSYSVAEDSPARKAVRMQVTEPAVGIRQELTVSIRPGSSLVEAEIGLVNTAPTNVPFAHWTNPMLAPGGRNELTPRTELIVPCTAMIVPDRDFTRWMGPKRQEFATNALRWIQNWHSPGDLLAENLTADFFGAFSHEADEGILRIADRRATPGMDIWTWGYPPPPERQREYSLSPNLGYVEMWGGTATNYSDEARLQLPGKGNIRWKEYFVPFRGIAGLTHADTNIVLSAKWSRTDKVIRLGLFPVAPVNVKLTVQHGGKVLDRLDFRLMQPFTRSIMTSEEVEEPPEIWLSARNLPLVRIKADRLP